jgi:hypothetical protein
VRWKNAGFSATKLPYQAADAEVGRTPAILKALDTTAEELNRIARSA